MGMLDWLFGEAPKFQPGQFGPSRPFPSQEDLDFARKNDEFRYSPEVSPKTYQITNDELGETNSTMGIRALAEMGELSPATDQYLVDTLARNKLAARRSAIASLGMNNAEDNVVGATDFGFDSFYGKTAQQDDHPLFTFIGGHKEKVPSTPVHEAIHRGLFKVRDELEGMPNSEETSALRDYIDQPEGNEYMVRLLMHNLYDDPERERIPEEYARFLDSPNAQYRRDDTAKMNALAETIAQKLVQRRKPGGPW